MPPNSFHRKLPHDVPSWVEPGSPFFITICMRVKGRNQLAVAGTARKVIATVIHLQRERTWFAHICLLMPDHAHLITSFPRTKTMKRVVKAWKGYNKRFNGIVWQEGFFDHRLRNQAAFEEKMHYIRMNPVRAGLVERPEEWPYVWDAVHGSPLLDEEE